jgi:hypothetical protein
VKRLSALLACALFFPVAGARAAGPLPPCTDLAAPAYPPVEAAPAIAVWHSAALEQIRWQPPLCTGWPAASRSNLVVALAGSFRFEGKISDLLARAGAISRLRDVRYWSATDKKWRPLAYEASALTGPDAKSRRGDFSATDMIKDAELYYSENDTRTGEAVYRLRVYENTPDRAVLASENITPIRRYFVTLFQPGALQSVIFLQRLPPNSVGVYTLSRTGEGTSVLADSHEESYVNRAVALYRQLAGIKTDQEPPAAR